MENYFLTVDGYTFLSGLTKKEAIKKGKLEADKGKNIGIGFSKKGKYKLFPLYFYV